MVDTGLLMPLDVPIRSALGAYRRSLLGARLSAAGGWQAVQWWETAPEIWPRLTSTPAPLSSLPEDQQTRGRKFYYVRWARTGSAWQIRTETEVTWAKDLGTGSGFLIDNIDTTRDISHSFLQYRPDDIFTGTVRTNEQALYTDVFAFFEGGGVSVTAHTGSPTGLNLAPYISSDRLEWPILWLYTAQAGDTISGVQSSIAGKEYTVIFHHSEHVTLIRGATRFWQWTNPAEGYDPLGSELDFDWGAYRTQFGLTYSDVVIANRDSLVSKQEDIGEGFFSTSFGVPNIVPATLLNFAVTRTLDVIGPAWNITTGFDNTTLVRYTILPGNAAAFDAAARVFVPL